MSAPGTIAVTWESSAKQPPHFERALAAIHLQLVRDFAPAWLTTAADVIAGPHAGPGVCQAHIVDVLPNAPGDFLGYHTVGGDGQPEIWVKRNPKWQKILSHESIEMLADPMLGRQAQVILPRYGLATAIVEPGDPVDGWSYLVDGFALADFVYPAWFALAGPKGTRYDHLGRLKGPLQMGSGGYLTIVLDRQSYFWDGANLTPLG